MKKGLPLKTCIEAIEYLAPPALAESWDNTGLLLQARENPAITNILLAIDLTAAVANEAIKDKATLVIAYHPPIFDPLKRLSILDVKTQHLIALLNAGITVYSPHTALDATQGGVNDWLADGLGPSKRAPLHPSEQNALVGGGRLVKLDKAITLNTLIKRIKTHLKLPTLRIARTTSQKPIRTIALCAGAGNAVLKGVRADVYWTGEMRHHDILHTIAHGHHVILSEHTHTERGYLPTLQKELRKLLGSKVQIKRSKKDADPITQL